MGAIQDSIQVSISRQSALVAQQGFGIPLFLGVHSAVEQTYLVDSPQAAATKFGDNSPIVAAVNAFFMQSKAPSGVVIGKVANTAGSLSASQTTTVTVGGTTFVAGSKATIQIGTIAKTYTYGGGETIANICTQLATLINSDSSLNTKYAATTTSTTVEIDCIGTVTAFSCIASVVHLPSSSDDSTCAITNAYGANPVGQTNTITIIASPVAGTVCNIVINSRIISYTVVSGDNTSTIAKALCQKIISDSGLVGEVVAIYKTGSPTLITLMAYGAGHAYSIKTYATLYGSPASSPFSEGSITGLTYNLVTALDACLAADSTWYGLVAQHIGYTADQVTNAEALADHVETLKTTTPKLYGVCVDEAATKNTSWSSGTLSDLGNYLRTKGYDHTYWFWSSNPQTYVEAAIMGLQFAKVPGSSAWKFKQLSGPIPDALTAADRANLNHFEDGSGKNGNFFETTAGLNCITSEGTVAYGEYIDIIYGVDYLTARIGEAVFSYLVSQEKVPFTNAGITAVASIIRSVLETNPDLVDTTTIQMSIPDVTDIAPTDKAARYLNKIAFSATLTGAIQKVKIDGKLSV